MINNWLNCTNIHKRVAFLATFIPIVKSHYKSISESNEEIDISYESNLHATDFETLLKKNLTKTEVRNSLQRDHKRLKFYYTTNQLKSLAAKDNKSL